VGGKTNVNEEPKKENEQVLRVRMFLGWDLSKWLDTKQIEEILKRYPQPMDAAAVIRFRRQGGKGL